MPADGSSPDEPQASLDDAQVLARVRAGESACFSVLVRRYNQRLYRSVRSVLRDEAEVEDVMQQAYLSAYRSLHQFEGRASFITWLTRIAVNEAVHRLRQRRRPLGVDAMDEVDLDETPDSMPAFSPEHTLHATEVARLLEAAVDALPTSYRSVFVLREVEGLSTIETAQSLDLSEDVVKTRLLRARAHLRREIYARTGFANASAFTFGGVRCNRMTAAVEQALGLRKTA